MGGTHESPILMGGTNFFLDLSLAGVTNFVGSEENGPINNRLKNEIKCENFRHQESKFLK